MPPDSLTAPTRRWFSLRYSLRTLLAIMGVASLACVAVSIAIKEYDERQREERARIQFQKTLELWDFPESIEEAR